MFEIPEFAWEFHGHRCPFMPIGYRMGKIAMEKLGVSKVKDHGAFALSEMGVGHPQTCMMDGIQAVTGCTYGKLMMERLIPLCAGQRSHSDICFAGIPG
jgi:formylmethanofuran dehydrogenase subunit E